MASSSYNWNLGRKNDIYCIFTFWCQPNVEVRAVQINRPPAQPAPPDRTRLGITRSDSSGGRTRVLISKTRRRRVGCRIPSSKTRKTRPARRPLKSSHFFQIPTSFSQIPTSFSLIPTTFPRFRLPFPDSDNFFPDSDHFSRFRRQLFPDSSNFFT